MIRRFELIRHHDPTGVSGVGRIAVGAHVAEAGDDVAMVRWLTEYRSTVIYTTSNGHSAMEQVERIHGHGGDTEIRWLDSETP